jgi:hypothetical protein
LEDHDYLEDDVYQAVSEFAANHPGSWDSVVVFDLDPYFPFDWVVDQIPFAVVEYNLLLVAFVENTVLLYSLEVLVVDISG